MRWFKNLKKWQRGGLIGLGIGIILAAILLIDPVSGIPRREWGLGEWVGNFHGIFFISFWLLNYQLGISEYNPLGLYLIEYGGATAIVVFYGGLGMLVGRVQQMANPVWKWLLTALLALFLLAFYVMHVI